MLGWIRAAFNIWLTLLHHWANTFLLPSVPCVISSTVWASIVPCNPFRWSFSQPQEVPSHARVDHFLTEESRGLSPCSSLLSGTLVSEPWPLSSLDSQLHLLSGRTAGLPYFFLISQRSLFSVVRHAMFSKSFFHVFCLGLSCSCRIVNPATITPSWSEVELKFIILSKTGLLTWPKASSPGCPWIWYQKLTCGKFFQIPSLKECNRDFLKLDQKITYRSHSMKTKCIPSSVQP